MSDDRCDRSHRFASGSRGHETAKPRVSPADPIDPLNPGARRRIPHAERACGHTEVEAANTASSSNRNTQAGAGCASFDPSGRPVRRPLTSRSPAGTPDGVDATRAAVAPHPGSRRPVTAIPGELADVAATAARCRGANRRGERCRRVPAAGREYCLHHAVPFEQTADVVALLDQIRAVVQGAVSLEPDLLAVLCVFAFESDAVRPKFLALLESRQREAERQVEERRAAATRQPEPVSSRDESAADDDTDGPLTPEEFAALTDDDIEVVEEP